MDILYSVGPDDGTDYFNLRLSLRSVSMYAKHVGRVIIAGYRPSWLSGSAEFFYSPGNKKTPKQIRILDAILSAIDNGVVKGEFLYSSDDHFLTRKVDFDNYPYYFKKDKLPTFDEIVAKYGVQKWKGYYRSLTETRRVLELNGYGVRDWSGHVNTHMNTEDASEVRRLTKFAPIGRDGYEPTCLFMNVRQHRDPVTPTFREDRKITKWDGSDKFKLDISDRDTFSVGDELDGCLEWMSEMINLYPRKSRFEDHTSKTRF